MEELITITEAAQKASVSDKTLRRAIEAGNLVAQPRIHGNQAIMIARQDLEAWIASRQVQAQQTSVNTSGLESRVEELEQTIVRMQELAEIDAKTDQDLDQEIEALVARPGIQDLIERVHDLEQEYQVNTQILNDWIRASRQRIQEIEAFLARPGIQALVEREKAKLEQTIVRMQEDYRLGGGRDLLALGPMDDVHYSNQFDTLEARVAGIEATVQRLQEQAEIDHKLAYSRIDALEERIRILEIETQTPEQINQEIDQLMAKPELQHLIEREKAKLAATQGTFELADFTRLLLPEYRSSATRGDVKAWLTLRPEPQGVKGDYRIDYHACGRADGKKGQMGKDQAARGEQLKQELKTAVLKALGLAGWTPAMYGVYACPSK